MHWVELNRFACAARHLLFEGDATDGGGERESNFVTFSFFGQRKKTRVQLASRGGFDLRAEGTKKAPHGRFFRGRKSRFLEVWLFHESLSFVISTLFRTQGRSSLSEAKKCLGKTAVNFVWERRRFAKNGRLSRET